jgi:YHS domain-containing protein
MKHGHYRFPMLRIASAALVAAGIILAPIAVLPALAFDEASNATVNIDAAGIGLQGHDPVAYFTEGKPTKGDAQFSASHGGATYHFASAANRDAFLAEPAKYAPQFGGFCAMAAVFEKKFDGDPNTWKIVDNKLYLNVNPDVGKKWSEDIPGNVSKADENWPKIAGKSPKELN